MKIIDPRTSLRYAVAAALSAALFAAAPAVAKTQKAAPAAKTAAAPSGAPAAAFPPVLPGWDSCKWNDPLHMTPKYMVGRVVAGFPHTPNGLREALPSINALYPGSAITRDYGDKVDIPCVGVIDMVVNSGGAEYPDSGDSWSWQVVQDKCGACNPNRCEAVSKSTKCGAAPSAGSGGGSYGGGSSSGGGGRSGGGSTGAGSTGGASSGGGASGGGSGRPRPDRSDVVAQAKADLEEAGHDLSGPCGAFAIVRVAAWRMRDEGAGLLSKPSGNNCEGYATDIIAYPDGRIYDVLVGAGESNGPAWQDDGTVDPSRYTAPEDPGL